MSIFEHLSLHTAFKFQEKLLKQWATKTQWATKSRQVTSARLEDKYVVIDDGMEVSFLSVDFGGLQNEYHEDTKFHGVYTCLHEKDECSGKHCKEQQLGGRVRKWNT